MKQIDFLPTCYQARNAQRRTRWGRWALVLAVLSGWFFGSWRQSDYLQGLTLEIAELRAQQAGARVDANRLIQLRNELAEANAEAELATWLRHPWPRSQLLLAAFAPLPESISLEELTVLNETAEADRDARRPSSKDEPAGDKPPPALQDLAELRDSQGDSTAVLMLSGTIRDQTDLLVYLADLESNRLIQRAELVSIEADADRSSQARFQARLVFRRGHTDAADKPAGGAG